MRGSCELPHLGTHCVASFAGDPDGAPDWSLRLTVTLRYKRE
ncbi:MAG TPA: hypothetical protein VJL86_05795 [Steroidobacteraceae bacterium]|nr:hypothetical protein [Steroidobacteraceae bacterium]